MHYFIIELIGYYNEGIEFQQNHFVRFEGISNKGKFHTDKYERENGDFEEMGDHRTSEATSSRSSIGHEQINEASS